MKMKRVFLILAKAFVFKKCVQTIKGIAKTNEILSFYDQMKFAKNYCFSRVRLNASIGSEAVVTARIR